MVLWVFWTQSGISHLRFLNLLQSHGGLNWLSIKDGFSPGFPGGAVVENLPANAGDTGSSPGLGRSHMPWSN